MTMDNQQEAIRMAEQGLDIPDIAKELGVSVSQVYRWLSFTEQVKQQRQERNEMVCQAYKDGHSIHNICITYSISKGTLYTILHRSDITLRRDANCADDDAIVQMYLKGARMCDIVSATDCSLTHIYKVIDGRQVPRRRPSSSSDTPSTLPQLLTPIPST